MVGVMAVMPTSFKRIYAHTVVFNALDPEAGHCQPKPLPETPGHSQASLFWGHCSLLLVPGAHKVFFVPSKTLFLQPHGSSVIKSHWPLKSNYLGILSPLADPQVGKSVVGPSTFLTVREFLLYNCSAVSGSSALWLYGGANGDLLQEGLCHMLCDPGLMQSEPLPLSQDTADPYLYRRHSNTQKQVWLSLCGVSGSWCTQDFLWALWASLVGMEFGSKCDFAPPTILLGLLLCHWTWRIFFWWDPKFSCW